MTARSLRDCNPGNMRPLPNGATWYGQTGVDTGDMGSYCVFDTPAHGFRAMAKQLMAYRDRHGATTIRQIIDLWAPAGDSNSPDSYGAVVAATVGIGIDNEFDFDDAGQMFAALKAMAHVEAGADVWQDTDIQTGVAAALS